jgi:hypothetical protein
MEDIRYPGQLPDQRLIGRRRLERLLKRPQDGQNHEEETGYFIGPTSWSEKEGDDMLIITPLYMKLSLNLITCFQNG